MNETISYIVMITAFVLIVGALAYSVYQVIKLLVQIARDRKKFHDDLLAFTNRKFTAGDFLQPQGSGERDPSWLVVGVDIEEQCYFVVIVFVVVRHDARRVVVGKQEQPLPFAMEPFYHKV